MIRCKPTVKKLLRLVPYPPYRHSPGVKPAKPQPITMYDSIDISQIPKTAPAVAGYVGGRWPTFPKLKAKFPHAHRLSIAVAADEDADMLDIEKYDATPWQAPGWVRRQRARGIRRPAVYCSLSDARLVLKTLRKNGIRRKEIRLVTAHYTFRRHRCSPLCRFGLWTRADGTQWTDHALGRNLDESLLAPDFFK